jgi:hypothetical protein
MANNLTWNPLIVDTAAATNLTSSRLSIVKIRWVPNLGTPTAEDVATIKDKTGHIIWTHKHAQIGVVNNTIFPDQTDDFTLPVVCDGLIVDALSSGTIYIYLDRDHTSIPVQAP